MNESIGALTKKLAEEIEDPRIDRAHVMAIRFNAWVRNLSRRIAAEIDTGFDVRDGGGHPPPARASIKHVVAAVTEACIAGQDANKPAKPEILTVEMKHEGRTFKVRVIIDQEIP